MTMINVQSSTIEKAQLPVTTLQLNQEQTQGATSESRYVMYIFRLFLNALAQVVNFIFRQTFFKSKVNPDCDI